VFAKEDPLTNNKMYGVIQNPLVRRRKGKRPIVPPSAATKLQPLKDEPTTKTNATTKPSTKPSGIAAGFNKSNSTLKKEDTASRPSSRDSTSTSGSKPTLKRDASDIFKAFAKGKTKTRPNEDSQDTPMSGLADDDDEGESEDEALFLDTGGRQPAKKRASEVKKERDDKAAKLRKMMEDDDEQAERGRPVAQPEDAEPRAADAEDDPEAVAWSESDSEAKPTKAAPEEPTGPKRRRGKRKVMKKRTMKDEDGYLVTKEEEAWESFSETDDEGSNKPKPKAAFAAFGSGKSSSQAGKATQKSTTGSTKKAAAGGKKDIMSFFGKK
jgi:DNA polymerase delta subunit 3